MVRRRKGAFCLKGISWFVLAPACSGDADDSRRGDTKVCDGQEQVKRYSVSGRQI